MISKEEFKKLIDSLKKNTGLNQEAISLAAGYEAKTLTQLMSKGGPYESAYEKLLSYQERLKHSTFEIPEWIQKHLRDKDKIIQLLEWRVKKMGDESASLNDFAETLLRIESKLDAQTLIKDPDEEFPLSGKGELKKVQVASRKRQGR